ncbi:MAG: MATE family efflux transporter [Lachnospiraceae bacterium]|nr:MATE family efflux transporter [Lachnospiraceae bacterium]
MKTGSCFKSFVKYSSLNVLGMLGLSCYILADTFFIAKGLGADGLAALNLAIPVYSFIHGSGLLIGMGGSIKYSILKNQGQWSAVNQIFTNAVFFTLSLAAVFFTLGLFCSAPMTRMMGADGTIYEMSRIYLQVILLFSPMFLCNNLLLCFVRNSGAPQLSMAAMASGSLSNILLDYIFIFPLRMGILGAVLATGIAPIISMLTLLPFFLKRKNNFHLCRCKASLKQWTDIFSGGLPSLIAEISSGTVIIVFNKIILDLQGNLGVAAYGIIANLSLVTMSIYTSIAQGIQPILSGNYAKNLSANVRNILRYALLTVAVMSTIIYAGIFLGAEQITGLFNSQRNAHLQGIAVHGLKYYFTACIFAGFNIVVCAYFTSTEHGRPAHVISFLRGFALLIPMAFLLSSMGGMTGVWLAFPVTEGIVSLLGAALLRHASRI